MGLLATRLVTERISLLIGSFRMFNKSHSLDLSEKQDRVVMGITSVLSRSPLRVRSVVGVFSRLVVLFFSWVLEHVAFGHTWADWALGWGGWGQRVDFMKVMWEARLMATMVRGEIDEWRAGSGGGGFAFEEGLWFRWGYWGLDDIVVCGFPGRFCCVLYVFGGGLVLLHGCWDWGAVVCVWTGLVWLGRDGDEL
ncbi:hypothetical protein Tco_0414517 [Tanacetum coccineum]